MTAITSDHLLQFSIIRNMFVNISGNKFKSKSWITLDLEKSISAKNRLLNNLMKKSKQAYFDKHF